MSKIIFFDIDGTLYDSRIGIPESTVNALNRLIAMSTRSLCAREEARE